MTLPIAVTQSRQISSQNTDGTYTVDFNSYVYGGTPPYTYTWNFGDGSISHDANPTHIYSSPGTYHFDMNIVDSTGLAGSGTRTSTLVFPLPAISNVSLEPTYNADGTVDVSFSSTIVDGAPPYTYSWTFGDGSVSGEANPVHRYSSGGTYEYTLNITDSADINGFGIIGTAVLIPPINFYLLSIDSSITDLVTVSPVKDAYQEGESVTLTINPSACYTFTGWSGDCSGTDPSCTLVMDSPKSVSAGLSIPAPYPLTRNAQNGTIISNPQQETYNCGSMVELRAVPDSGYQFLRWEGDVSGSANPTSLAMDGGKTVTAVFETSSTSINSYNISLDSISNGSLQLNPVLGPYNEGETVTVSATADACYALSGWSGDCSSSTGDTCSLTMGGDKTVGADFQLRSFPLQKTAVNGSIKTLPDGTGDFACGATVQLEAVANPGYQFVRWEGDIFSTANPANLSMDAAKNVTAVFKQVSGYTLNVDALGEGRITLEPQKDAYTAGERVNLTPVANDTCSVFSAWQGDCAGSGMGTCTLTMDVNKSVTAQFTKKTFQLTTAQSDGGQVTLTPPGDSYDCGSTVELSATADAQYRFARWEGDETSTENPFSVTMDANKTINALFLLVGTASGAVEYIYDELHRLVQASYPEGPTLYYSYDEVGNLLSISEIPPLTLPVAIPDPQPLTVKNILNKDAPYTIGDNMILTVNTSGHGIADLYIGIIFPDGNVTTLGDSDNPIIQYAPKLRDASMNGSESFMIFNFIVDANLPKGDYTICSVLTEPGSLLQNAYFYNENNWLDAHCVAVNIF
ncbi:InlB B-repeat-containing protein [Candidatus Venteria ishoeyi]|nr:PKD domain-containing protein [Candidatus Venteria ishoeyi]